MTPAIAPLTTPIGEMYRFRLDGAGMSDLELREIEDWTVAPRLLQVSGVVDATLVMVEHIVRNFSQTKRSERSGGAFGTIREAALEMEWPIFFSLCILIAAYLPLFTLERVERRLFTPMAFTVCSALLGSLLCSLTLIPVLATYLFRHPSSLWQNPLLSWLEGRYEGLLRSPGAVAWTTAGIIGASLFLGTLLGTELLRRYAARSLQCH